MKRWTLLLALVSLLAVPLFGEPVTLKGEVLYVATHPAHHEFGGQFVIMKDGSNEIQVELAPPAFLSEQGIQIGLRDAITIVGTREIVNNSELIIAREVTKGGKTVKLRDANGAPLWPQK